MKKYLREGGKSNCDLNSPTFDRKLIEPIQKIERPCKNNNNIVFHIDKFKEKSIFKSTRKDYHSTELKSPHNRSTLNK